MLNIDLNALSTSPSQANQPPPISDSEFVCNAHRIDDVFFSDKDMAEEEEVVLKGKPKKKQNKNNRTKLKQNSLKEASAGQFQTIIYNELVTKSGDDNRPVLPIYCDGHQFEALIDSGATKSFIDRSVVDYLKLKINREQGNIFLGHKGTHVARTGETEQIEIECNEHTLLTSFEILELSHPFIIGMDLFCKLGLSIGGITDGRANAHLLPEPMPDRKPGVLPLETPSEELTDSFKQEKNNFLEFIHEALSANVNIPTSSHCTVPEMEVYLKVPEGSNLWRRPRIFADSQLHIFDEQIERWLKDEVITYAPPGCRYNNTLTLAAKKDLSGKKTKWRVCLDPRPLNKLLPDDKHPVPLISDILQQIGGHAIYSTIDLTQAYHRLPIPNKEEQMLTAFTHRGTQYMFKRAPFGLKPLTSHFQRGMTRILGDLPFVLVFVDDIVIFSKTRAEHAEHVKCVLERLTEANLIVNPDKCHFYATQIVLLGFVVDLKGKRVDPSKLANIEQWVAPTTGTQVQSYMGTFNFFREYIPLFSTLAAPLDKLRHLTKPFKLNKTELEAFNTFKNLLTHAPILHFPDFSLLFYVATDASNVGIAAVLYQRVYNEDTKKWDIRYISFMARSLQERERRYSATQKELLGIKELNAMLTGWHETIMSYDFKVEYRPGVMNVLPDHLSRLFPQPMQDKHRADENNIVMAYMHVWQGLGKESSHSTISSKSRQQDILKRVHSLGHLGANAMVRSIHADEMTWPKLVDDCLAWVKRCPDCQKYNIARKGYHPLQAINAKMPGDHMAVDLTGPFPVTERGNVYLLILVDVCTRFVFLKAIPDKRSTTVAQTLFETFCTIGFPRILQSDNGPEFANRIISIMTSELGVQHRLLTPYHPRGNGVAERHVKIAVDILRKEHAQKQDSWDLHVPMAQLAMNTRVVALHNSSPFSLFFARKFNGFHNFTNDKDELLTHKELADRLKYMTEIVFPAANEKARATQQLMIDCFNATILHNDFPVGAKVMAVDPIMGNKLTPRYEGPYTIVRRTSGGSYVLHDATNMPLGRNYAPSQLKLVLEDPDQLVSYEIERIVGHRPTKNEEGEWDFRVKWKGYPDSDNSWVPQADFNETRCIREYWQKWKEEQIKLKKKHQVPHTTVASNRQQLYRSSPQYQASPYRSAHTRVTGKS